MTKALKISKKAYNNMSVQGIQHVKDKYNFDNYEKEWIRVMDEFIERNGSWDTRIGYKRWHLMEVA